MNVLYVEDGHATSGWRFGPPEETAISRSRSFSFFQALNRLGRVRVVASILAQSMRRFRSPESRCRLW